MPEFSTEQKDKVIQALSYKGINHPCPWGGSKQLN